MRPPNNTSATTATTATATATATITTSLPHRQTHTHSRHPLSATPAFVPSLPHSSVPVTKTPPKHHSCLQIHLFQRHSLFIPVFANLSSHPNVPTTSLRRLHINLIHPSNTHQFSPRAQFQSTDSNKNDYQSNNDDTFPNSKDTSSKSNQPLQDLQSNVFGLLEDAITQSENLLLGNWKKSSLTPPSFSSKTKSTGPHINHTAPPTTYILRPPRSCPRVKAVIHFIPDTGPAGIFSLAPRLWYRDFLERLANNGFVVVATAYCPPSLQNITPSVQQTDQYSSSYYGPLQVTDACLEAFDTVATDLALEFGAIPIVSLGLGYGATINLIAATFFPQIERAAYIYIAFKTSDLAPSSNSTSDQLPPFPLPNASRLSFISPFNFLSSNITNTVTSTMNLLLQTTPVQNAVKNARTLPDSVDAWMSTVQKSISNNPSVNSSQNSISSSQFSSPNTQEKVLNLTQRLRKLLKNALWPNVQDSWDLLQYLSKYKVPASKDIAASMTPTLSDMEAAASRMLIDGSPAVQSGSLVISLGKSPGDDDSRALVEWLTPNYPPVRTNGDPTQQQALPKASKLKYVQIEPSSFLAATSPCSPASAPYLQDWSALRPPLPPFLFESTQLTKARNKARDSFNRLLLKNNIILSQEISTWIEDGIDAELF